MFHGWRIVGIAGLCQGVSVGTTFYVYGAFVKPLAAEFGASRLAVTLGLTLLTIIQGLFSPALGRLLDRGSPRSIMIAGVVVQAAGFAAFSQISAFWQAGVLFALPIAIGAHCFGPFTASTLVSRWFARRRGRALGVTSLGASFGGAVFPALVTALIAEFAGWRGAVLALSGLLLVLIAPIAWLVVGEPEDVGTTPDGEPAAPGGDTARLEAERELSTEALLRDRNLWAITLAIGFGFCPVSVLLASLIPFATDLGHSPTRAGALMGGYLAAGAIGRVFFGWLTDRIDRRAVVWLAYAWFAIAWLPLLGKPSFPVLAATAAGLGVAVGGIHPIWGALTGAVYGRRHFGRAMGLMNAVMLPFAVGGAPIAARVFDVTGSYRAAFAGFLVCFVAGSIAIAFLREAPRSIEA